MDVIPIEYVLNFQVLLVAVLAFTAVIGLGGAMAAFTIQRRNLLETRLHGYTARPEAFRPKESSSFLDSLGRLGTKLGAASGTEARQARLMRAGFQSRNAIAVLLATKFLFLLGAVLLLIPSVAVLDADFTMGMLMVAAGAGLVFFLPDIYVDIRARKRAQEVRMHLPDMVDLLEVCVSGGMGLDQAWNAVADEIRQVSPLLADEMALTTLEMQLGEERGVAMRHMADRTGADDLSSMVSALVQSQRFGTSVSQALRVFAENMREMRASRAEENAETMSVKMLFPMILFIFPVIFIVAVGPAAISVFETFELM
ncbi:MAG: type II secretion system F family protein [Candidatus Hydrogenedentota bacterium]